MKKKIVKKSWKKKLWPNTDGNGGNVGRNVDRSFTYFSQKCVCESSLLVNDLDLGVGRGGASCAG